MNLPLTILTEIELETTPPQASMQINNGAVSTTSSNVTLTLNVTDSVSGVTQMRFSNDDTWDQSSLATLYGHGNLVSYKRRGCKDNLLRNTRQRRPRNNNQCFNLPQHCPAYIKPIASNCNTNSFSISNPIVFIPNFTVFVQLQPISLIQPNHNTNPNHKFFPERYTDTCFSPTELNNSSNPRIDHHDDLNYIRYCNCIIFSNNKQKKAEINLAKNN